jgi:hypothetical protein
MPTPPISFTRSAHVPLAPSAITDTIADVSQWSRFEGYGPLPGIAEAVYELRTDDMVDSRIRCTNTDGSTHTEEIYEWEPGERIVLVLQDFSPPLSMIAAQFVEEWELEAEGEGSRVVRRLDLHPKNALMWLPLWLISLLFRRAIAKQLREMSEPT